MGGTSVPGGEAGSGWDAEKCRRCFERLEACASVAFGVFDTLEGSGGLGGLAGWLGDFKLDVHPQRGVRRTRIGIGEEAHERVPTRLEVDRKGLGSARSYAGRHT